MQAVSGVVLLALLAGCGDWRTHLPSPAKSMPSKYQFDYSVTNATPIALLRVFDDGGSTYFQFRGNPPEALVISAQTTTGEAVIPHEQMSNYAVIRGVYRQSRIASANQPVVARKLGDMAPMANIGPVALPKPIQQAAAPVKPEPVQPVSQESASTSVTHTIRFARNSSRLGPRGTRDLAALLKEASGASKIEIRACAFYPKRRASIRLAAARAATIRAALAAAGVEGSSIRIDTEAAAQPLIAEVVLHRTEQGSADQPLYGNHCPLRSGRASPQLGCDGCHPSYARSVQMRIKVPHVVAAFVAIWTAPVHADQWGCEVLLCLSNPAGPTAVAECKPPIHRLWRHLGRGHSFPSCQMAEGPNGSSYAKRGYGYYDQCPAGTQALASGERAMRAGSVRAVGAQSVYRASGATYVGIGTGDGYFPNDRAGGLPPKVCVGSKLGAATVGYDARSSYQVSIYDRIATLVPQRSPRIIDVYIDDAFYQRVRW